MWMEIAKAHSVGTPAFVHAAAHKTHTDARWQTDIESSTLFRFIPKLNVFQAPNATSG